ncbi:GTP-binding protein EngB [Colletotrichum kahawae]|uniref:GTP-binding protein EngB n=1 Tax=Colletotrichum kahawae TaxID=34407 RepID=A0AAD9YKL8_COLKA|nr:GTP-binding protein EngB [Colletotrichum kahawae]
MRSVAGARRLASRPATQILQRRRVLDDRPPTSAPARPPRFRQDRPSYRSAADGDVRRHRGFDDDAGRSRFQGARDGPPTRMNRPDPRSSRDGVRDERRRQDFGSRQRMPSNTLDAVPENFVSQEELDKISKPQDIWESNTMFYVPPPRAPPKPQPKPTRPQRKKLSATPSSDDVKSAILGFSPKDAAATPPPTPTADTPTESGTITTASRLSAAHADATSFFRKPPAAFLYSAQFWKQHPINTTTPELCIIGASNCGKSSFVNALTGAAELAKESWKPGKTVTMNAYGVGNPPTHRRKVTLDEKTSNAARQHGLVLVDTPGYGHASRREWGEQITQYVNKRTMLCGVVLLLSAEKKVGAQDEAVMGLLAASGRPVVVVFTKLDKVSGAGRARERKKDGAIVQRFAEVERCFGRLGAGLWVPRVHLTATKMERVKDGKTFAVNAAGMAGVRMEILEMLGLRQAVAPKVKKEEKAAVDKKETVQEEEKRVVESGKAMESDPKAWSGKTISFEELEKKFGDWSS